MGNLKKWTGYLVFGIVVTLLWGYLLFPSQTAIHHAAGMVARLDPTIEVHIDEATLAFPWGLVYHRMQLNKFGRPMLMADHIKVAPSFTSLFASAKYRIEGSIHRGRLNGIISRQRAPEERIHIQAGFEGIQLSDLPAVRRLGKPILTGKLSGRFDYTTPSANPPAGRAQVALAGVELRLVAPLLSVKKLSFEAINAQLAIAPPNVEVLQGDLTGPQVRGRFKGSIVPGVRTLGREMALTATLIPSGAHRHLFNGQSQVNVTVTGPLEQLRFNLHQGRAY